MSDISVPAGSTASPPVEGRSGVQILILTVAAFVIVTTEYLILGILPGLARDLNVSISTAGQLVTLFAFTVMLFGPPLTAALTHVDRKTLFAGILGVFALSNVLAAVAPNIWVLALTRFIPALFLPVFWGTASETAGQLAGPTRAGRAVGQVYMGISAALVFGIPLGTLAANALGWRGTFWGLAALSLAMATLILMVTPKLPASTATKGAGQAAILKSPRFLLNVGLSVIVFTAMFLAYTYLADMLERLAGVPAAHVGWWLMGYGAVGMVGNWLGGRIVDRSPLGATIGFAATLGVAMLVFVPLAGSTIAMGLSLVVWGVASTALFPICQVRVMKEGGNAQALAGTINVSAANAGIGIGAIGGGLAINQFGLASLGLIASLFAFLAAVIAGLMHIRARTTVTSGEAANA